MSQSWANASLPHALTVAHQRLCEALDLGIREFKQYHRFSNARQVRLAVGRFVEEFRRLPTWWAELQRRAGFVESSCGPESEYRRAMGAAWKAYREDPKNPFGPELLMERQYFSRLRKAISPPICLTEVLGICQCLEEIIRMGRLRLRVRAAFEHWAHQCRLIQRKSERLEVDGCHYLYHVYQAANPNPSTRSEWVRAQLASEAFHGGYLLEPMRVAADSLVASAAENLACSSVSDLNDTQAEKLGPKQYLTGWRGILDALDLQNNETEKGKVTRPNRNYEGPIIIRGKGAQPKVERTRLIDWWNKLEVQWQDEVNQRRGIAAAAGSQHPYGRTGQVAPEIRGEVKNRRRDRKR